MQESQSLSANAMEGSRSARYKWIHSLSLVARLAIIGALLILICCFITSALLFSSGLDLAKMIESHAVQNRAAMLRANQWLTLLLPLQFLTICVAASVIFAQIQHPGTSRINRALIGLGEFLGILLLLLLGNYIIGVLMPNEWTLRVLHLLER